MSRAIMLRGLVWFRRGPLRTSMPITGTHAHIHFGEISSKFCRIRKPPLFRHNCMPCNYKFVTGSLLVAAALSRSVEDATLKEKQFDAFVSDPTRVSVINDYKTALLVLLNRLLGLPYSLVQLTRITLRSLYLTLAFGPLFTLLPLARSWESTRQLWLEAFLAVVTFSGPTFIKLGQWASTRRDLFPADFCDVLGRLHHDAAQHSWSHSRSALQRAFSDGWEQWCRIDPGQSVHSGCVGQVYKGYLDLEALQAAKPDLFQRPALAHTDGMEKMQLQVAIKILHPGVMESVEIDLTIMKLVARLIDKLPGVEWLSVPEIISQFEQLMKKQIDLRVEAENLDVFNSFFSDDPSVRFPVPIWPLVHPEILIETFEEGVPISDFTIPLMAARTPERLKKHLAKIGISTILKMVFVNNFVHADLHPGNIIVQYRSEDGLSEAKSISDIPDDVSLSHVRLVFLDVGIVAALRPRDLENLHKVFAAVVKNRGDIVGDLFLEHAVINRCRHPEQFKATMAELVDDVHRMTLHLEKIQVSELLSTLFGMLMEHRVKLESNFSSVILAIVILEGLGRSLDPQLDIIREARSLIFNTAYFNRRQRPWTL